MALIYLKKIKIFHIFGIDPFSDIISINVLSSLTFKKTKKYADYNDIRHR